MRCGLGITCYYAGKYEEALVHIRRALEIDPSLQLAHEQLALVYERMGRDEEAVEEFIRFLSKRSGRLDVAPALREAFHREGIRGFWRRCAEMAAKLSPSQVTPYFVAAGYVAAGEKDLAFEWLEKAYQAHIGFLVHLNVEPRFEPLRSDARFADLLRRIGHPLRVG